MVHRLVDFILTRMLKIGAARTTTFDFMSMRIRIVSAKFFFYTNGILYFLLVSKIGTPIFAVIQLSSVSILDMDDLRYRHLKNFGTGSKNDTDSSN